MNKTVSIWTSVQCPANQEQAKNDTDSSCNPTFRALLAWKIGPAKFQSSIFPLTLHLFINLISKIHQMKADKPTNS